MKKITNKSDFESLIDIINECLGWYERKGFDDNIYNLIIENGDKLNIVFANKTVAHLFGINTECLKAKRIFSTDSYSILKKVCGDSYRLYNEVLSGRCQYSDFISDFAFEKTENFKNICGIDVKNIEFICKYKSENSYITGKKQLDADYYIAYNVPNGLSIVGFKETGDYYYPMTNRYIDFNDEKSMEFLQDLLTNQVITMPNSISIYRKNSDSLGRSFYLYNEDKINKLKRLQFYSSQYGAIIDISYGYKYVIERLMRAFDSNNSTMPIFDRIFYYISRRTSINISAIEREFGKLPEHIIKLINTYNISINQDIQNALDEHTRSIIDENNRIKEMNERHLQELATLREELLALKEENERLSTENKEHISRERSIIKILRP